MSNNPVETLTQLCDRLDKLREGVTPGPWSAGGGFVSDQRGDVGNNVIGWVVGSREANAAFVPEQWGMLSVRYLAALDPDTLGRLIEAARRRRAGRWCPDCPCEWCSNHEKT